MLKNNIESLHSSYHANVLYILQNNGENLTENSSGFFFDVKKISEKSIQDLNDMMYKIQNVGNDVTEKPFSDNQSEKQMHEETDAMNVQSTVILNQKFVYEYNNDVQKSTEKSASILKFMNAKKKYMRNVETLMAKNEPDLKKELYIDLY